MSTIAQSYHSKYICAERRTSTAKGIASAEEWELLWNKVTKNTPGKVIILLQKKSWQIPTANNHGNECQGYYSFAHIFCSYYSLLMFYVSKKILVVLVNRKSRI